MASLVTVETNRSVEAFVNSIESQSKQEDSRKLIELISEATGFEPKIWGNSKVPDFIIGFGKYSYQRKGTKDVYEWFNIGLAPRKNKITLSLTFDVSKEEELLEKLGKHKCGKGCLYINKLGDVNIEVLKQLFEKSKNSRWHDS